MKHFLFIIFGILLFISCNSDNKEEEKSGDNKIVEITTDEGLQKQNNISENKVAQTEEIQFEAQFKKFLDEFKKISLPYKIKPEEKLDFKAIPLDQQAAYLSKAEDLTRSELKEMEAYAKFYYICNPVTTSKFTGIVYGRSEMGSSYYVFCTFNRDGKLISHIEIAMYQMMSAGPQAGQEYIMTGEISKDMKISLVADDGTKYFQILEDGKIVKK